MYIFSAETPLWKISIVEQNEKITHLYFQWEKIPNIYKIKETLLLKEAFHQLDLYFSGKIKTFSLPLNPTGTPFMQKIWNALQTIPYGTTVSYKEIAQQINNPKAVRAVGMANNRNPIPIFIPCHRVIGSNGSLVGYGAGVTIKKQLLDIENIFFTTKKRAAYISTALSTL